MPAQLKIILGAGNPSFTVDLGTDEEALQVMRDYLKGTPSTWGDANVPLAPDEAPRSNDWDTADDSKVVESFCKNLFKQCTALRKRGQYQRA